MALKTNFSKLVLAYTLCISLLTLLLVVVFIFFYVDSDRPQPKQNMGSSSVSLSSTPKDEITALPQKNETTASKPQNKTDNSKKKREPVNLGKDSSATKTSTTVANSEIDIDSPLPSVKNRQYKKYKLYFVLDDCGGDLENLEKFLSIPIQITYAVIPFLAYSAESAKRIHQRGKEIIIHQPMEPLGVANPGEGAIFTWMSKDVIFKVLARSYREIPYAVGMNNHMGSKATSDSHVMSAVLDFVASQGMFFLDSKTTPDVVGHRLASRYSCPYVVRNAMFVDNEKDRTSIESAINSSLETAKRDGHAVMIGHVLTTELADALLQMYPDIIDEGYEFDRLSDYFTQEDEELE